MIDLENSPNTYNIVPIEALEKLQKLYCCTLQFIEFELKLFSYQRMCFFSLVLRNAYMISHSS